MNSDEELAERIKIREELARREKGEKLHSYYTDEGPLRRELYSKHTQFFAAGAIHQERAAIAGNRCGKTTMSCFETSLHLIGHYPHWWEGKRFDHPVDWWAASNTGETTRNILQFALMGPMGDLGTGMVPKENIIDCSSRRGLADAIDTVNIKHSSGGVSTLAFKSYDQGREKFQGTAKHGISLDEEPNKDIYFECLTRLMTTNGLMIATFTPMSGMSDVVLLFMPELAMSE